MLPVASKPNAPRFFCPGDPQLLAGEHPMLGPITDHRARLYELFAIGVTVPHVWCVTDSV